MYKYIALDKRGNKKIGYINSKNREKAEQLLFLKELIPISLKKEILFNNKLSDYDNYQISLILSKSISSGISIQTTLRILSKGLNNKKLKLIISELLENLERGESIYKAMKSTNAFDIMFLNLVRIGETTGNLDLSLKKSSDYFNDKIKFKKKIKEKLIYPSILFSLIIILIIGFNILVLPNFLEIFSMDMFSILILKGINIMLIFFIFIMGYLLITICFLKNSVILSKLKVYKQYKFLDILYKFYIMFSSNIGLEKIMQVLIDMECNINIKNKLKKVNEEIILGEDISSTLYKNKYISNDIYLILKTGEFTGTLEESILEIYSLSNIAYNYKINKIIMLIEPFSLIIISIILLIIILSISIPMFTYMDSVLL